MQILVIIAVLILFSYFMKCSSCSKESFHDWQITGPVSIQGTKDCRYPHYSQDHPMFMNKNSLSCGSCIYNALDQNFDGVLPDWQYTLQAHGNTIWKSPPLDSEIYKVPDDCSSCTMCDV